MKLRDRLQKIFALRRQYKTKVRIASDMNHRGFKLYAINEVNNTVREHNKLVFWFMKKLPEVSE